MFNLKSVHTSTKCGIFGCFSIAVIKHYNYGDYKKEHLILGSWFQRASVHGHHGMEHGDRQAGMALG